MSEIQKAAVLQKQAVSVAELALINAQSLRELTGDEVFVFRMAACDDQVDRDFERFTVRALEQLAELFVGKTVLMDHNWSAGKQTARIYAAAVERQGEVSRLVLRCYMYRSEETKPVIDAIESGILRECSVGCAVKKAICSICGKDQMETCCVHQQGSTYDGVVCVMELDDASDAYEVSMVAVPAQHKAGVIKSKRYGGACEPQSDPAAPGKEERLKMAQAIQRREEMRYGGMSK